MEKLLNQILEKSKQVPDRHYDGDDILYDIELLTKQAIKEWKKITDDNCWLSYQPPG